MQGNESNHKRIERSEAGKRHLDFDGLLVHILDEALTEILGEKIASMLWTYWATSLGITRENVSSRLPELFESIQAIFGTGYETVGERVIKRLYAKANVPLEYSDKQPLGDYAEKLKHILAKDPQQI